MGTKVNAKLFKTFDIGYGYLKFLADNGIVKKEKAVIALLGESLNEGELSKDIKIITVDGVDYIIGDGVYKLNRKPITANETENRANNIVYKVLGLYALAQSGIPAGEKATILTGLPFMNMDEKEQVVKAFKGVHDIKLNGKAMQLNIEEVLVTPQGLGAFYSLLRQRGTKVLSKKFLLSDLGFHTINHLPIANGDINKETVYTNRDLGIQHAYKTIAAKVNLQFKKNYSFYDVDDLLDNGVEINDKEGKRFEPIIDFDYVKEALRGYAKDVWEDVVNKYSGAELESFDEIIFSGGTAKRVETYLEEERKYYCSVLDDPQDAQVIGYDIMTKQLG